MGIFDSTVLFILGFFILIRGAQILIHGAVSIAKIFRVSTWFIGTVIVSAGTTIPEFSINVAAAFSHHDVGLATVIGSNIFNVLFILGFVALFSPIIMHHIWVKRDLLMFIGITIFTGVIILFPTLGDPAWNGVTRLEGGILLAVFVLWFIQILRRSDDTIEDHDFEVVTIFVAIIMLVGGVIGVFIGGQWVVNGAAEFAKFFGVSETVIGFTIVALGTSLPELTVSIMGLIKGTYGVAVGNVVGASIFNLLGVLGITSLIHPISVFSPITFDVSFVIFTAIIWYVLMFVGKRYVLTRWKGITFLALYAFYIFSLFNR